MLMLTCKQISRNQHVLLHQKGKKTKRSVHYDTLLISNHMWYPWSPAGDVRCPYPMHYRDQTIPYVCEYVLGWCAIPILHGSMMSHLPCFLKYDNTFIILYLTYDVAAFERIESSQCHPLMHGRRLTSSAYACFGIGASPVRISMLYYTMIPNSFLVICCILGPLRVMYAASAPVHYRDQTFPDVCEYVLGYSDAPPLLGSMMSHLPCILKYDNTFIILYLTYVVAAAESILGPLQVMCAASATAHYRDQTFPCVCEYVLGYRAIHLLLGCMLSHLPFILKYDNTFIDSSHCHFFRHSRRLTSTAYVCFGIGASHFILRRIHTPRLTGIRVCCVLTIYCILMYFNTVCLGIRTEIPIIGDNPLVIPYRRYGKDDPPTKFHDQEHQV